MVKKDDRFFTSRDKTLAKLLFLVFLSCNVFLNWSNFSWFLSFKTAPIVIGSSFTNFTDNIISSLKSIKLPEINTEKKTNGRQETEEEENETPVVVIEEEEKIDPALYCEENEINIPALNITAPLVEAGGITEKEYRESLDRGVVHFPGSSFPGEAGLSILLGHSAPPGWPKIKHDWVFTSINDLSEGDTVEICYNNKKWTYSVINEEDGKKIYEVGEEVPPLFSNEEKKEVVLMSCWPPGSRDNRIGVRAVIDN